MGTKGLEVTGSLVPVEPCQLQFRLGPERPNWATADVLSWLRQCVGIANPGRKGPPTHEASEQCHLQELGNLEVANAPLLF